MIQSTPLLFVARDDPESDRIQDILDELAPAVRRARRLDEALDQPPPGLCLLDLELPDSNGIDTLRRYRTAAGSIPVVALIDDDDDEATRQAAIEEGAQDCLAKESLDGPQLLRALVHARIRHQQTLRLRESEERLRALVQAVPDLILEIDEAGRVLMANRGPQGLALDHLLGRNWQAFVPDDQIAVYDEARRRVFQAGHEVVLETHVPDEAGETTWYHVTMAPLMVSGTVERCVVLCRNVTGERHQRERFRHALEAAPGGMLLVDETGRIVMANRAVERLFGFQHDELLGVEVERLVPPAQRNDHIRDRRAYADAPEPRGVAGGRAVSGITKAGAAIPLEISLTPLTTARRTEVLCSITDLRSRRALEEQLRQSQKLEVIGLLAGGVAHDFNNLLTAILTFGGFVQEELDATTTAHQDMGEVLAAARRAAALTSQLLAFSRRQPTTPQVVSLAELCIGLQKMLARVIGEDIHLEVSVDDDCPPVLVDPGTVENVLLNLCVNAQDAMRGGGDLQISVSSVELSAEHLKSQGLEREPGRYVRLRVRDTGHGMDEVTRQRIFEPFYTTKQPGRGTGLGLSTVHGIVTQAGGFITVESEVGVGSTFDLWFPPGERDALTLTVTPETAPLGGNERVLLVEDDTQLRTATTRSLARLGYRVIAVANGAEALAAVERDSSFDLVVTDLVMPDMSGDELAEHLLGRLDAPLLFITGYAPESIARRGIVARGVVVRKPFSAAELTAAMRRMLDAGTG